MNPGSRDLVTYRLARARETLEEARLMAEANHWHACVNRLYYACFYAVNALLIAQGLSSPKHAGVRSLFGQHFVKTGLVSKDKSDLYNELFARRQETDYKDFCRVDSATVRPWIEQADAFVDAIEKLISVQGE
jgi:uncharacterized protein (UPF0332 family)